MFPAQAAKWASLQDKCCSSACSLWWRAGLCAGAWEHPPTLPGEGACQCWWCCREPWGLSSAPWALVAISHRLLNCSCLGVCVLKRPSFSRPEVHLFSTKYSARFIQAGDKCWKTHTSPSLPRPWPREAGMPGGALPLNSALLCPYSPSRAL